MEQYEKIYRRRFYTVVACGLCVLFAMTWLFVKGALTPIVLAAAGFFFMVAMFVALMSVIISFQRSAREFRKEQIAKGISADLLDKEQCIKTIRTMKRLIALFALFLVYGFLQLAEDRH
jgi:hypothetical protein